MDTVLIAAFGGTTTESAELTQLTMTGDPGSARAPPWTWAVTEQLPLP
jgi:hypothetical protein